jgi:hypothetical protein
MLLKGVRGWKRNLSGNGETAGQRDRAPLVPDYYDNRRSTEKSNLQKTDNIEAQKGQC